MNKPFVTILTATYNRAHLLPVIYASLQDQTDKDFQWLIVDDGSTDDTYKEIQQFQTENTIHIEYSKKENGGKHTALNVGIRQIDTELTMIVDSDDKLLSCAVEEIRKYHLKYGNDHSIASYNFLRCYSNGKPIVGLDKDEFIANYIKYRIKGNRPGDMAEVFRTDILKANPFPEFPGEKFLSEDIVWIEIGKKYDSVFINKAIYQCEYHEGGLTANDKPLKFASPLGSMMRGKQLMSKGCGIKANIKGAIIYDCYREETPLQVVELSLAFREKVISTVMIPIGKYFNKKWRPAMKSQGGSG